MKLRKFDEFVGEKDDRVDELLRGAARTAGSFLGGIGAGAREIGRSAGRFKRGVQKDLGDIKADFAKGMGAWSDKPTAAASPSARAVSPAAAPTARSYDPSGAYSVDTANLPPGSADVQGDSGVAQKTASVQQGLRDALTAVKQLGQEMSIDRASGESWEKYAVRLSKMAAGQQPSFASYTTTT